MFELKGPAHSKNENIHFLAPAQTKRMQPILVSWEAPFRSNLQKTTGPVRVMTLAGPTWPPLGHFFCKLLLNGASHDTKIGGIILVGRELKTFLFFYAQTL